MTKPIFHLFIAGAYDKTNNLIHSAAYLANNSGRPAGKYAMAQECMACMDQLGIAIQNAFEAGCLLARMQGVCEIQVHVYKMSCQDAMRMPASAHGYKINADGGVDYFGLGVYAYKTPDNAPEVLWQASALLKARALCQAVSNDGLEVDVPDSVIHEDDAYLC